MAKAKKVEQLVVTTEDRLGMLAQVTDTIASQNINIDAMCAYGMKGEATFYILTKDKPKAKSALSAKGWQVKEDEVVALELENRPGALREISEKFKAKGVNLIYSYGSTCECGCPCRFILKAEDNDKAMEAIG